ncbi:MAG: LysM repeat protein [Nonlabens sp.]|jgi:LysM repeat protein
MRLTQVFVFLCCLAMGQDAYADKVYLEYNSSCMDIYEYHYNGNTTGKGHIVYHIALNDIEKVILEVGVEARLNQPHKPNKTISCDDLSLNERVVRQINSGATQLYIVKKDGRGYNVSPVGIATYAQIKPTSTGYSTLDTRFSFNFDQPSNGINLATNGSESKVVYKGLVSNSCPKSYLFDKTRERGGRSFSSYVIVPEIGIVEEKNGFNATDAQNSVLRLVKINGKPYQKYIETYCADAKAGSNASFYTSGRFDDGMFIKKTKKPSVTDIENGNGNTNGGVNGSTTTSSNPYKVDGVRTNSTFNCSVYKDLDRGIYMDFATGQPANTECGGNTYINGRKVGEPVGSTIVTPPPPPPVPNTTTTTHPPTYPPVRTNTSGSNCNSVSSYGKHVVQREETLYGISRLYGLTLAQIRSYNAGLNGTTIYPCMTIYTKTASKGSGKVSTDYKVKQHTVRSGETLYQLASKYGYTVDRFRSLNGLGLNDNIYPGQVLKTQDCNCEATSSYGNVSYVPSEYNATQKRINTGGQAVTAQPIAKRRFHIVAEDDTVYSISKQYNIGVAQLRKVNDLEENEIIIPYQRIYLQ